MMISQLPQLIDKPHRAEKTPAACAARDAFIFDLSQYGATPAAVAETLVTTWEETRAIRCDKFPSMKMLDQSHEWRVSVVVEVVDRILANANASDWRAIGKCGESALSIVRDEIRQQLGR